MRIHLTAAVYVLVFAFLLELPRAETACLCIIIGAVMCAEMLNTSVERLCDFAVKAWNPRIRVIKDVAAGAVLVLAIAAVAVGALIFLRPELFELLKDIVFTPYKLIVLMLSFGLSGLFVFLGPVGIKDGILKIFKENSDER